ncbi:MAG: tetratricopeptide repeat protein, partial [Kofleriaceae bacterium]
LVKKDDYQRACDKFQQAIALDPSAPGVMLNLGLCNEKLGKLKTSLKWYRDAQIAASSAKLSDYEEAAKERTADLLPRVPHVRIELAAAPADTQVRIDGERVDPTDYGKFDLDPGHHALEATAAGKRTFKHEFDIKQSSQQPIAIRFEDVVTTTVIVDHGRTRRIAGYVVSGAGVAAIAVSGILARNTKQDWDAAPVGEDQENYNARMNRASVVFAGGLVLVAGGVVLWLTAPRPEQRQQSALVPVISPDQLGFAYSRGF